MKHPLPAGFRHAAAGLLQVILILLGVTFISFYIIHLSPKNPAEIWLVGTDGNVGQVSEEAIAQQEAIMGLDKPVLIQYLNWLSGLAQGDLGTSFTSGKAVTYELSQAFVPTFFLSCAGLLLTLALSVPIGCYCAVRRDQPADHIFRVFSYVGISVPSFLLSLLLMWLFCVKLKIFPVVAKNRLQGMILPLCVLTIQCSAKLSRQVRGAVLSELGQPYVSAALARGCSRRRILFAHVLKNLSVSLLTWSGIYFGMMLGGLTVIETIFSLNGLGKLLVEAISYMDYYLIQGIILLIALLYLLINLGVDLLSRCIDPRIRKQ